MFCDSCAWVPALSWLVKLTFTVRLCIWQTLLCCIQSMNVITFELFPVVAVWCWDPVFGLLCKLLLFCLLGNMWTSYCPSEATRYLHISLIRYFSYFQLLLKPLKSDLLHLWISVWCFLFCGVLSLSQTLMSPGPSWDNATLRLSPLDHRYSPPNVTITTFGAYVLMY